MVVTHKRKSGLRKALIIGATAAALSLFPAKTTYGQTLESQRHDVRSLDNIEYLQEGVAKIAQPALSHEDSLHIFNPFIQPNDSTLVAYGSGDANKDNKIDLEDYSTIQLILGNKTHEEFGEFHGWDYNTINSMLGSREFDRADVDGDGVITQTDADLVLKYINKEIQYLPGHWNKLKTRQEREDWLDKCLKIDWTSNVKYNDPNWICVDSEFQTITNTTGLRTLDNVPSKYNLTDNGRFNLPIYGVAIDGPNNFGHTLIGVVIGDNPLKWESWKLKESEDDNDVKIGEWNMPTNSKVIIAGIYKKGPGFDLTEFNIDAQGTPSLTYTNPNLVLTRPEPVLVQEDENKPVPVPWVNQNYPNPFSSSTTIEYSVPQPQRVSLEVFNSQGQKLESLVDNEMQDSGKHSIRLNAGKYASGLYFYKLKAEDKDSKPYTQTKKMMIVK
ncbi:MAG: T9SS type A sorting domain-containing protein [Nanoarchaeota archaeon]|nr:T9SS type A sorting domain-containing protein [Nanoarchaeota archaeon]